MNTSNKQKIVFGSLFAAALTLSLMGTGCGGDKPAVKNPKDVKAAGNGNGKAGKDPIAEPVPEKPKRVISADVKTEFRKLVKRYDKLVKAGKRLAPADCQDLAKEFASLYASSSKLTEAKFNEGAAYLQCGDLAKAEASFRALVSTNPTHGAALNNLGMIAFARGQTATAVDFFRRSAAAKNSGGYANLAMLDRAKALRGDGSALKEGVDNIHRSLAVDSSNISAYEMLATLIYDHAKTKSQLEIARLITVQALKIDSKHAPLYNLLGLVLLKMDEVTRALAQFRKAVSFDNRLIEAHMNIGAITLSFRDYKAAESAFQTVLGSERATKEMKREATVGLGVAFRGQRKYKEAMAEYEKALKLDPSNDGVAYNMGILVQDYLFDASNPEAAIRTLQQALRHLERYAASGTHKTRRKDTKRRIKNIREMIPMLREQQKMMAEMQKAKASTPAPAPTPAPKPAPKK